MSSYSPSADFRHTLPLDMKRVLVTNTTLMAKWQSLTPLARNEWICWVTIVKQAATRAAHLRRFQQEVLAGQRRPCCWPGCPHRRASAGKWFA